MTHRRFLIGSTAILVALALLAAWGTLGDTLSNKNAASATYQQALQAPVQVSGGRIPVQVGISVNHSDYQHLQQPAARALLLRQRRADDPRPAAWAA